MQHKRSRLTTKILAFVLILALVFPASAFASVADVAKDTRFPGKSLANTYPAYTDIEWQISLAENAQAMVTVPTNMTEEELGTALSGDLTLSLDRDSTRGYLNPEKFPYPYQGGALDTWMTQWTKDKQPQNLFRVTEMGISVDEAGKVSLKLWIDINCYFGNRSGNVDYSAPHSNGGAYLDLCGYYTLNVTAGDEAVGSIHTKIVPYDSFRTVYELYDDIDALAATDTDLYVSKESMGQTTVDGYDMPYLIVADSKESVDKWLAYTDLVESDPDLALTKLANGDFDDLRVPMFASNVHSNENAAVNGILEFATCCWRTRPSTSTPWRASPTPVRSFWPRRWPSRTWPFPSRSRISPPTSASSAVKTATRPTAACTPVSWTWRSITTLRIMRSTSRSCWATCSWSSFPSRISRVTST